MAGRTIIVTSGSGLLGSRTAEVLAADPQARVVVTGRRRGSAQARADAVNRLYGRHAASAMELDLASLDSVRSFVDQFAQAGEPCDALVAGTGVQAFGGERGADGFELAFAANYLGNFVLANLLLPHCSQTARIVVVASGAHDPSRWLSRAAGMPAPQVEAVAQMAWPEEQTDPARAVEQGRARYAAATVCSLLFVRELAARLGARDSALAVNAFDPGLTPGFGPARGSTRAGRLAWNCLLPVASPFVRGVRMPMASARDLVRLVGDPGLAGESGAYFARSRRKAPSAQARDREKGRMLWEQTVDFLAERAPGVAARIEA